VLFKAVAEANNKQEICFVHFTNTMAQKEGDFEKGENFGSLETVALFRKVLRTINNNE